MNILGRLLDSGRALGQWLPPQKREQAAASVPGQIVKSLATEKLDKHQASTLGASVFFHSISKQFESSTSFVADFSRDLKEIEQANTNLFDFKKVADTVLGFIGKTLRGAKNEGADDDKIGSLLDHARQGVLKGIEEATEELKQINQYNDDIAAGIEKSRDRIEKGIDELADELLANRQPTEELNQQSAVFASQSRQEATSHLEIVTADGDKVTLSFSAYQQHDFAAFSQRQQTDQGETAIYGFQQQRQQSLNFSYSVTGELDEQEQEAIALLVKDINKVQKEFFSGDVEKAYKKALELGINSDEIATVALNLAKVESTVMTQAYRDVAALDEKSAANKALANTTKPIADYLSQFEQLQALADKILASNKQYFKDLMEQVVKADTAEPAIFPDKLARFQAFHQPLFNRDGDHA